VSILRTIGSAKAAVLLLSATAVACLVGTLLPQAQANHFVYRAAWFLALLGALCINLICCTLGRYASWPNRVGSVITHLSILFVVAGAIVDGVWGVRGDVQLRIGESMAAFGTGAQQRTLPFSVHLTDFTVERYPPTAELTVVQTGAEKPEKPFEMTAGSERPVFGAGWAIRVDDIKDSLGESPKLVSAPAGSGKLGVRIKLGGGPHASHEEFLLEGEREEIATPDHLLRVVLRVMPDATTRDREFIALQPGAGNGFVEMAEPDGSKLRLEARPGQKVTTQAGAVVEVLRYAPHFVIDGGAVKNASERPVNPAVQVRVESKDGTKKDTWLFAHFPDFRRMHGQQAGPVATYVRPADIDFVHQLFLYAVHDGDIAYAVVSSGREDVPRGSAVSGARIAIAVEVGTVEIVGLLPQATLAHEVAETASGEGRPGALVQWLKNGKPVGQPAWLLAGGDPAMGPDAGLLAAVTGYGARVKAFRSTVQVVENGAVVKEHKIEVNRPLVYGGYSFYQSSYDREREKWTGLEVARSPGVPLVYAGFILFVAGLVVALYVQPLLKRGRTAPNEEKP